MVICGIIAEEHYFLSCTNGDLTICSCCNGLYCTVINFIHYATSCPVLEGNGTASYCLNSKRIGSVVIFIIIFVFVFLIVILLPSDVYNIVVISTRCKPNTHCYDKKYRQQIKQSLFHYKLFLLLFYFMIL